jgi:hypothetical protein
MLVPGGGLIEVNLGLALSFAVLATAATIAWLRWGVDWAVLVVVVTSMALSSVLASAGHHPDATTRAAHEFPLVVLVVGMVGWSRAVLGRVPGFRWIGGRRVADTDERSLRDLAPVDRCRAVALLSIAGAAGPDARAAIREPDVVRRAQRVGFAARLRCGGDPFRVDHAHARAALALTGQLDSAAMDRFAADASRSRGGVPASEPGWIRTLDATLAAAALDHLGDEAAPRRWSEMLDGPLALRRGHRPAWWWSPLGVGCRPQSRLGTRCGHGDRLRARLDRRP